jgi:hypothetical protein
LKITSLCPEFDDIIYELQEFELNCFSLKNTFNASNIEMFVGTQSGKMLYYSTGWFQNTKEIMHNNKDEGPVTNVVCHKDVVCWSTLKNIRVIHYAKKQRICIITRPEKNIAFPDYLYISSASKPTIVWRHDSSVQQSANGVGDYLYVAWLNIIKICRLRLKEKDEDKFHMEVVKM